MSAEQLVNFMCENSFVIEYGSNWVYREHVEEFWTKIASQLNLTVPACKTLWDDILNDYKNYLAPSLDGLPKTSWYLSEKMSNFIPYISIPVADTIEQKNTPKKETKREFQNENDAETIDARAPPFRKHKVKRLQKEKDGGLPTCLQDKTKVDFSRRMFLLSLLPDVERLSEKQLDEFRLNILLLVEKIKGTDC